MKVCPKLMRRWRGEFDWFNVVFWGVFIGLFVAGLLFGIYGCANAPASKPKFTPPPQSAPVSPPAKQTLTDTTDALKSFDAFTKMLTDFLASLNAPQSTKPVLDAVPPVRAAIVKTQTSASATVTAADARDREVAQLRADLDKANGAIDTLNKKVSTLTNEFHTKLEIYAATLGLLTAVAVGLLVWVQLYKTALGVGLGGFAGIGFLLALAWFDAHKGIIFASVGGVIVAVVLIEVVWRKFHDNLSWGQAFIKAITTSPAQDVLDLESTAKVQAVQDILTKGN